MTASLEPPALSEAESDQGIHIPLHSAMITGPDRPGADTAWLSDACRLWTRTAVGPDVPPLALNGLDKPR